MPRIHSFTAFAPQRSGTNFVQQLLLQNFNDIKCHNIDKQYVWKHEPNTDLVLKKYKSVNIDPHLHMVVTKSPYKWVESIIRKPVDIKIRRPEVLKTNNNKDHILILNTNLQKNKSWKVSELNLVELVKLYNEFYNNWLGMESQVQYWGICKYENLLIKEQCYYFLNTLQGSYKLKRKQPNVWQIPTAVGMSDHWSDDIKSLKIKDYLDFNHCRTLNSTQINIIDQFIDKSLLERLGYSTNKPESLVS